MSCPTQVLHSFHECRQTRRVQTTEVPPLLRRVAIRLVLADGSEANCRTLNERHGRERMRAIGAESHVNSFC